MARTESKKVVPYEHRGLAIRSREIKSEAAFSELCTDFHVENDIWLKKLYALKIIEHAQTYLCRKELLDEAKELSSKRIT